MIDLLRTRRHPLARYGIALALAGLAVLVRMLLPLPPGAAKIAKLNVTLVLCCLSQHEARAVQA